MRLPPDFWGNARERSSVFPRFVRFREKPLRGGVENMLDEKAEKRFFPGFFPHGEQAFGACEGREGRFQFINIWQNAFFFPGECLSLPSENPPGEIPPRFPCRLPHLLLQPEAFSYPLFAPVFGPVSGFVYLPPPPAAGFSSRAGLRLSFSCRNPFFAG